MSERDRLLVSQVARGVVGFDIETTVGVDVDAMPPNEREKLRRRAARDAERNRPRDHTRPTPQDRSEVIAHEEKRLALNPFTAKIISIAFHSLVDGDELALVVGEAVGLTAPAVETTEPELLSIFWEIAARAETLTGYNSRHFDVPVLLTRSAILGVEASVDLLANDKRHVDIFDLMSRASGGRGGVSLELAAFTFGIPVKTQAHGGDVHRMFEEGRLQEVADYNLEDARATAALYQRLSGTWIR